MFTARIATVLCFGLRRKMKTVPLWSAAFSKQTSISRREGILEIDFNLRDPLLRIKQATSAAYETYTQDSTLVAIFVLALLYAAAARLGLLTAIPPGYVTAIWPSSGIALAAVLLRG